MGADFWIKLALGLALKVLNETFISKVAIHALSAWAKTTDNQLDDKVVLAMAEALGVEADDLKKLSSKSS